MPDSQALCHEPSGKILPLRKWRMANRVIRKQGEAKFSSIFVLRDLVRIATLPSGLTWISGQNSGQNSGQINGQISEVSSIIRKFCASSIEFNHGWLGC